MVAYQNEQMLRQKLDSAIDVLEFYGLTGPHTPNYHTQHHRSITIVKREANIFEFTYMGAEFVIIKETRPITGIGYLKTYRKEFDINNYPKIRCIPIPELLIISDTLGNLTFNAVVTSSLDKGYFDKVYAYLSNYETSTAPL